VRKKKFIFFLAKLEELQCFGYCGRVNVAAFSWWLAPMRIELPAESHLKKKKCQK
jgi:hypothetical protein